MVIFHTLAILCIIWWHLAEETVDDTRHVTKVDRLSVMNYQKLYKDMDNRVQTTLSLLKIFLINKICKLKNNHFK